jgi:hypothetical protein
MSHPNPQHDRSNEYPDDNYKPSSLKTKVAKKMPKGSRKVSLAKAFPGEARMDKIKSKLGSDDNYKNRAAVKKAFKASHNKWQER